MLTKIGKSKMSTVEFNSATKGALRALVDREAVRTGSRTVAYEVVAQTIGASSSWIRKFLSDNEAVAEPRMTLFSNIRASYENLCTRVEQEHQSELVRLAKLRRQIDAVTAGFGETLAAPTGAPTRGTTPSGTRQP